MFSQKRKGIVMQFSTIFKELCKERGISQKQALLEMGMNRNAAQGWSKGQPSYETLQKIASYFDVSMDRLTANGPSVNGSTSSSVVFQSTANNTSVNFGGETLTELEKEMLNIFRKLDRRSKLDAMARLYEIEDSMTV